MADSVGVLLSTWFSIPGLPSAVLINSSEPPELLHAAGLAAINLSHRLVCLPVWITMLTLGQDAFRARIKGNSETLTEIW